MVSITWYLGCLKGYLGAAGWGPYMSDPVILRCIREVYDTHPSFWESYLLLSQGC